MRSPSCWTSTQWNFGCSTPRARAYVEPDGVMNGRIGAVEVMEAVRSHPHYGAPKQGANHGRGVSMGFCRNNTGPASVIANVLDDGTVSLVEGSVDIAAPERS